MVLTRLKAYIKQKRYIQRRIPRLFSSPNSNSKQKVSIITGQLAAGGVERVLLGIIEGLPKEHFEVVIYVTDLSNNVWMNKFQEHCSVVHITKELDWSTDQELIIEYLTASIAANSSDVVFITNSEAGYKALPKIKLAYILRFKRFHAYDLLHTHGTPTENDAFLRISQPYDKYLARRIVISQYLKDYLCSRYPVADNKVTIIHNGLIDPNNDITYDREKGCAFLQLRKGERAITYVGRLQPDKSPDRLVELAHAARQTLLANNAFIAVVGDGNLRDELEARSLKYGILGSTIRFYGFTEDPMSLMAASYFTILTSNLEGIPMSVLESMDTGTPVITPAVGGLPEMVPSSAGLLVDFNNTSTEDQKITNLTTALQEALALDTEKYQTMRKDAKMNVDNNFRHMKEDYIKLFEYGRID